MLIYTHNTSNIHFMIDLYALCLSHAISIDMCIFYVLTQVKDKTVFETVPSKAYQCNLIHNFNGDEIKAQNELRVKNFGSRLTRENILCQRCPLFCGVDYLIQINSSTDVL